VPPVGTLTHQLLRPGGIFSWQHSNPTSTGFIEAMRLTDTHILELKSATDSQTIFLRPNAVSAFPQSISIGGTQNTMPNQVLSSTSSILNRGLADARYLTRAGTTLSYGTSSAASGLGSIGMGANAVALGGSSQGSFAIGHNVRAELTNVDGFAGNNVGSMALGWNSSAGTSTAGHAVAIGTSVLARGSESTAIGWQSKTAGYGTTAIGPLSHAFGGWSTAIGYLSSANGYMSLALGPCTTAKAFQQVVVGVANIPDSSTDTNSEQPSDHVFIVGNGTIHPSYVAPSNAFTIKRSGDAWLQGSLSAGGPIQATGAISTTGDLTVSGTSRTTNAEVSGTLRITPRGGISMGEFTYDPRNP
jgi:hypothetical protein